MSHEEYDFMMKAIKGFRHRTKTIKESELRKMLPPFMRKATNTIQYIIKEILGEENYHLEYD